MFKFSKLLYLACFLLLFLSCSRDRIPSSSVRASGYRNESKNINSPKDPAITRFTIPPELGIMNAQIHGTAGSFKEVIELLESNSQKLINSISQTQGCSIDIVNYQHPVAYNSSKIISSNAKKKYTYSSNMDFKILISFASSVNIQERIQQINKCLEVIPELKIKNPQENKDKRISLVVSQVTPTIKDANQYRNKILTAKLTGLKQVASLVEPATQFNALDTKCTSQGIVTIVDRSLSEIELDVDLDCHSLIKN